MISHMSSRSSGVSSDSSMSDDDDNAPDCENFTDRDAEESSSDEADNQCESSTASLVADALQLHQVLMVPSEQVFYLIHEIRVTDNVRVAWELGLVLPTERSSSGDSESFVNDMKTLFVVLPAEIPVGFKEGLVSLLDYADDGLHCRRVVVATDKLKSDKKTQELLCRVFQFVGFAMVPNVQLRSWVQPEMLARCQFYVMDLDQM